MISSSDLFTGLGRLIRYHRVISDAENITIEEVLGGRWIALDIFGGEYPVPRQRYEFSVLTLLRFCDWMLGRPLKPLAIEFTFPEPLARASYEKAFGCPLRFGEARNRFLVSEDDLARKLPTAAPELAELHARIADQALRKLEGNGIAFQTREAIARRLQDGAPTRLEIATDLRMGERTFQRRLADDAVSFTQLVEETRRDLAQHYLANPKLAISEIVHLLGYSDQSTFFRACQRWFGESPNEYRKLLLIIP